MTFRHVDATFPKYFIRTYGPQAGECDSIENPLAVLWLWQETVAEKPGALRDYPRHQSNCGDDWHALDDGALAAPS